jgi:fatty-acyl-CoA synthase
MEFELAYGKSIARALEQIADLFPDDLAVVQGDQSLTWSEFDDQAARLATFLARQGVGPGDRVAIGSRNRPEYLVAWLAILKLRATPVNVNFRYRRDELAYILDDSGAKVLFYDDNLAATVAELDPDVTIVAFVPDGEGPSAARPFAEAIAGDPHPRVESDGDLDWLMYTGGTTGLPKAVAYTQESLLARMGGLVFHTWGIPMPTRSEDLWKTLREQHDDRLVLIPAAPLMHGTGINGSLNAFLSGGTVVLLGGGRFDAEELAQTVERHRATDVHLVGDVFCLPLADTLEAARDSGRPYDLSSLRRIQSVGTVWSAEVKARLLQEADISLVDIIAATEGGPFALSISTRDTPRSALSDFRLGPAARLLDDDMRDVEPGSDTVGILAAPAQDGARYQGDPERSSGTYLEVDGVVYAVPGDMAQLRADGTLRFLGRGSGVINTGGEKVYAAEVEDTLRSHPDVRDALVVGVPDPRFGALVGAVIQPVPGHTPEAAQVGEYVATALAGYKRPRQIAFVQELRRTAAGKADLAWARELLEKTTQAGGFRT